MVYFSNLNYTKSESDARYAKLGAANVFAGQNTFNQRITSYRGFQTSNGNADILSMNDNAEKKANIVYKQTTTGYKNWCHMQYLWTANDTNYTNLLTFTFKPDSSTNNNIVEFTTALGSFSFNKPITFKDNIELKNPTNNNGAILTNFQYQHQNLTSLKFNKNSSRALLILEVNNDNETAKIAAPNTNNNLSIKNLSNPNEANDAANKAYVDSRTTTYKWEGTVANNNTQNLETISWDKHIIGVNVFRKRSDSQWFCINNNMTQQIYRDDSTGQFKLYGSNATGSPNFTDNYRVYITYIN